MFLTTSKRNDETAVGAQICFRVQYRDRVLEIDKKMKQRRI